MNDLNELDLLSAYIDGELTPTERNALETRLETDAALRRELASLRATVDLIAALPTLRAPRDFTLPANTVRRARPRVINLPAYAYSAISAAAALILLITGVLLIAQPPIDSTPPAQVAQFPTATVVIAPVLPSADEDAPEAFEAPAPAPTFNQRLLESESGGASAAQADDTADPEVAADAMLELFTLPFDTAPAEMPPALQQTAPADAFGALRQEPTATATQTISPSPMPTQPPTPAPMPTMTPVTVSEEAPPAQEGLGALLIIAGVLLGVFSLFVGFIAWRER